MEQVDIGQSIATNIGQSTQDHVIALAPAEVETLCKASENGNRDVVKKHFDESNVLRADGWDDQKRGPFLLNCVELDLYDAALQIRNEHKGLAFLDGEVLRILARKADAFVEKSSNFLWRAVNWVFSFVSPGHPKKDIQALELLKVILEDIVKKKEEEIYDMIRGPADVSKGTYPLHTLFIAAEMGNTKFIAELIRQLPYLIEEVKNNTNKHTIFHIAVMHRCVGIYNLLYVIDIDQKKKKNIISLEDENGNTMLHLAGEIAKIKGLEDVFGFTFQMLRDLLWFTEVVCMISKTDKELLNKLNNDKKTPFQLFTQTHKDLAEKSEEWMKGTASHCMVVSALFYTVVFAAAFAVPGGYNQTNGTPILKSKATFMVFVVASAISLFSSAASILMFLSILTSGYAKPDFLQSSKKLMLGLATLFLSTTTMTIAFSVTFFVLYYKHLTWVPILITVFGVMPIFLFAWLICPLLADVYRSTCGSKYLFGPKKQSNCKSFFMCLFSKCT